VQLQKYGSLTWLINIPFLPLNSKPPTICYVSCFWDMNVWYRFIMWLWHERRILFFSSVAWGFFPTELPRGDNIYHPIHSPPRRTPHAGHNIDWIWSVHVVSMNITHTMWSADWGSRGCDHQHEVEYRGQIPSGLAWISLTGRHCISGFKPWSASFPNIAESWKRRAREWHTKWSPGQFL
jgi:hypothetical protein